MPLRLNIAVAGAGQPYDRDEDHSWWRPFRTEVASIVRSDPLATQALLLVTQPKA